MTSLYVIDPRVQDYRVIVAGLPQGAEWLLLDPEGDGLTQIATYLVGHAPIDALHVFSHGTKGAMLLGDTLLDTSNLSSHASSLAALGAGLTADADILLYGCDVGAGAAGQSFISQMAALTGADIAASTNLTGSGGDWVLETSIGPIDAPSVTVSGYAGTLNVVTGTDGSDTLDGTIGDCPPSAPMAQI